MTFSQFIGASILTMLLIGFITYMVHNSGWAETILIIGGSLAVTSLIAIAIYLLTS